GREASNGSRRAVTSASDQPVVELVLTPFRSSVKSGEALADQSSPAPRRLSVTTPPAPIFHVRVIRPSVSEATPLPALARALPLFALVVAADAAPGMTSTSRTGSQVRLMPWKRPPPRGPFARLCQRGCLLECCLRL